MVVLSWEVHKFKLVVLSWEVHKWLVVPSWEVHEQLVVLSWEAHRPKLLEALPHQDNWITLHMMPGLRQLG